jgi:hypothetical protein
MEMSMKLKPAGAAFLWATLVIVVILAGVWLLFEEITFRLVIGAMMAGGCLMHAGIIARIRNPVYLVPLLFYLFGALTFLTNDTRMESLVPVFAGAAVIAYIFFLWALITRRIKWRYREILELAARPIEGSDDGFTARPYPAGEASYTNEELAGFGRFLLRNVIAYPYIESDRAVFVVPRNMLPRLLGLARGYNDATYVSFGFDGKVAVHIAKKDYKQYREELTFDELCRSFAGLFEEFLGLYREGRSDRIIRRLDELKFFS